MFVLGIDDRLNFRGEGAPLSSPHLSPKELLRKLSKVYAVDLGEERQTTEVPKQVREITEKLKLDIFPNM